MNRSTLSLYYATPRLAAPAILLILTSPQTCTRDTLQSFQNLPQPHRKHVFTGVRFASTAFHLFFEEREAFRLLTEIDPKRELSLARTLFESNRSMVDDNFHRLTTSTQSNPTQLIQSGSNLKREGDDHRKKAQAHALNHPSQVLISSESPLDPYSICRFILPLTNFCAHILKHV